MFGLYKIPTMNLFYLLVVTFSTDLFQNKWQVYLFFLLKCVCDVFRDDQKIILKFYLKKNRVANFTLSLSNILI